MPLMDEFREEREKIKTASPRAKWGYFKDYYLKWVLGIGAVAAFLLWFVISMVTKKEEMLYVSLVNFMDKGQTEQNLENAFAQQYLENPKKQEIILDYGVYVLSEEAAQEVSANSAVMNKYSYEDQQKLSMIMAAGGLDLMITGEDVLKSYIEYEFVIPLKMIYTEEELKPYQDAGRLLMYKGEAVAICMEGSKGLEDNLEYNGENAETVKIYAVFMSNKRVERAKEFLKFLDYEQNMNGM